MSEPYHLAINAAFRAILAQDWTSLATLQRAYPDLVLDPGARWTISRPEFFRGIHAMSTWNAEETGYVVAAKVENVARLVGFRMADEMGLEVVWWGTRKTPAGTWAAQFTVEDAA